MSAAPVILVTESDEVAATLTRALERKNALRPLRFSRGEDAVLWAGANRFRVAIVDFSLPGISGLETILSIRQRRPDAPVVIVSDAGTERAAVDAFHAGVVDYITKHDGFEDAVAHLIHQLLDSHSDETVIPPQLIAPDLPEELIQPTYQNRLRVIGRQLDLYGYHSVSVLEVVGGFLVRALRPGSREPEALEFADPNFPQLLSTALAGVGEGERRPAGHSELIPTGYEDFLRAIGSRLDTYTVEAITIFELEDCFAVSGIGKVEEYEGTTIGPFQWLLREDDIAYLLDEAYRRRRTGEDVAPHDTSLIKRLVG